MLEVLWQNRYINAPYWYRCVQIGLDILENNFKLGPKGIELWPSDTSTSYIPKEMKEIRKGWEREGKRERVSSSFNRGKALEIEKVPINWKVVEKLWYMNGIASTTM